MKTNGKPPLEPSRLVNFRDLGGIRVGDGVVRRDKVWRSDDVSLIPADQAEELVAAGLVAVLDLRAPDEARFTGRGTLAAHGVAYHHLPLTEQMAVPEAIAQMLRAASPAEVGAWYSEIVVERPHAFVRGLEVFAAADGAVLFHCAAGKDRTGIFAAVLLEALGAEPEDIVADYVRTADVLDAIRLRVRPIAAALMTGESSPGTGSALDAHPEAMIALLEALRSPRVVDALAAAGLDDDLRTRLRARLVERT